MARLLAVGHRVTFRHPLVRSAVYKAAAVADRVPSTRPWPRQPTRRSTRTAALGTGTSHFGTGRGGRRRARALGGPGAGTRRTRCGGRLPGAGGRLTLDPALRTQRALAAARAKFEAAAPDAAFELLATAEMGPLDELQRARLERLRAQIGLVRSSGTKRVPGLTIGPEAAGLLVDAAKRLEPLDAELARETYVEAMTTAMWDPRDSDCGARQAAEAARAAPPGPQPPSLIDLLLDGLTARFTEPYEAALPSLRRALDAFAGPDGRGEDEVRWLGLPAPLHPSPSRPRYGTTTGGTSWRLRRSGSLAMPARSPCFPTRLTALATMQVLAGEFTVASALMEEAYEIL